MSYLQHISKKKSNNQKNIDIDDLHMCFGSHRRSESNANELSCRCNEKSKQNPDWFELGNYIALAIGLQCRPSLGIPLHTSAVTDLSAFAPDLSVATKLSNTKQSHAKLSEKGQ